MFPFSVDVEIGKALLEEEGLTSKSALQKLFIDVTAENCEKKPGGYQTFNEEEKEEGNGYWSVPNYWKLNGAWR